MKITLDHEQSQAISEKIHTVRKNDWDPTIYHLSDGLGCPLGSYCRMVGIKAKPNRKTAARFTIGQLGHLILEENFKTREAEYIFTDPILPNPCYGHLDVMLSKEPVDFKITSNRVRNPGDLHPTWPKQSGLECVFSGSSRGWLGVLEIVDTTLFTAWKLDFSREEIRDYHITYINNMSRIMSAVDTKNPFLLEPYRTQCKYCLYISDCPRRPGL